MERKGKPLHSQMILQHEERRPETQEEKEEFRNMIKARARNFSSEINCNEALQHSYKCFVKPLLRGSVEDVLNDPKISDPKETSSFWLLAAALKKFYDVNKTLPVAGSLPDMTSTTDFYLELQKM